MNAQDAYKPYGYLSMTTDMKRLVEIERTIAYQDQQIQDLSDMVNAQWKDIDKLKKHLARARERLENLENPSPENASEDGPMVHEKPPHY